MEVYLEEISFNHADASRFGSLAIRKNELELVTIPEWRRGITVNSEDSRIAYVSSAVSEKIAIEVKLSSSHFKGQQIEVRATAESGNVLGDIQPVLMDFDVVGNPTIAFLSFPAQSIKETGVGVSDAVWHWEYRIPEDSEWVEFQFTRHRVYTVLNRPTAPWDDELPWADVLEVACSWAENADDKVTAASRITEQLFALGQGQGDHKKKLTYARTPTYAHDYFNCTGFLQLLRTEIGEGQTVNCDDCATIVSTFANILGCNLSQSGMGLVFHTHFIYLIGDLIPRKAGFPRHAVAWEGECESNDPVYDACLKSDADGDPGDNGHSQFELPLNLQFEGENRYQFRLVRRGQCDARPQFERCRRSIGHGYMGQRRYGDPDFLKFLKTHYQFEQWSNEEKTIGLRHFSNALDYLKQHPAFAGWDFIAVQEFSGEHLKQVIKLLASGARQPDSIVEITLYETESFYTNDFVLQLLAQFHQMDLVRIDDDPIGDLTYSEPLTTGIVMKRGPFVGLVRRVGKKLTSVLEMARAIEGFFDRGESAFTDEVKDLKEENMAHKFAGKWHSYIQTAQGLEDNGIIDMSNMKANGDLDSGDHEHPAGQHVPISGKAFGLGPLFRLNLASDGESYEGTLVHESNNGQKLICVGTLHFTLEGKAEGALDQEDPPWVITKP